MKKTDGGPAFPSYPEDADYPPHPGMSLRDWFAGQALGSMSPVSPWAVRDHADVRDSFAHSAYLLADAILKVRDEG